MPIDLLAEKEKQITNNQIITEPRDLLAGVTLPQTTLASPSIDAPAKETPTAPTSIMDEMMGPQYDLSNQESWLLPALKATGEQVLKEAVDGTIGLGKDVVKEYSQGPSQLGPVGDTAVGLTSGILGFLGKGIAQALEFGKQIAFSGEYGVDLDAVRAAGDAAEKFFAYTPKDPLAKIALGAIGSVPEGVKLFFHQVAEHYKDHPNIYAGIKTIGDLAELYAYKKVFESAHTPPLPEKYETLKTIEEAARKEALLAKRELKPAGEKPLEKLVEAERKIAKAELKPVSKSAKESAEVLAKAEREIQSPIGAEKLKEELRREETGAPVDILSRKNLQDISLTPVSKSAKESAKIFEKEIQTIQSPLGAKKLKQYLRQLEAERPPVDLLAEQAKKTQEAPTPPPVKPSEALKEQMVEAPRHIKTKSGKPFKTEAAAKIAQTKLLKKENLKTEIVKHQEGWALRPIAEERISQIKPKAPEKAKEAKKSEKLLDKEISSHKGNIRDWFIEPENWGNKARLTYREVAKKIAKDKDIEIRKIDKPVDPSKPFGKTVSRHIAYYNGKQLREFPKEVYDLVQKISSYPELRAKPKVPEKPKADVQAKEPWEMTKGEYREELGKLWNEIDNNDIYINHPFVRYSENVPHEYFNKSIKYERTTDQMHYRAVRRALSEGKPVPERVLADYPELRAKPEAKPKDWFAKSLEGEIKQQEKRVPESSLDKLRDLKGQMINMERMADFGKDNPAGRRIREQYRELEAKAEALREAAEKEAQIEIDAEKAKRETLEPEIKGPEKEAEAVPKEGTSVPKMDTTSPNPKERFGDDFLSEPPEQKASVAKFAPFDSPIGRTDKNSLTNTRWLIKEEFIPKNLLKREKTFIEKGETLDGTPPEQGLWPTKTIRKEEGYNSGKYAFSYKGPEGNIIDVYHNGKSLAAFPAEQLAWLRKNIKDFGLEFKGGGETPAIIKSGKKDAGLLMPLSVGDRLKGLDVSLLKKGEEIKPSRIEETKPIEQKTTPAERQAEEILSISEPFNVRGKVTEGNWAVEYETPSPFGAGRETRTKYFWRKKEAQAWIEKNKPTKQKTQTPEGSGNNGPVFYSGVPLPELAKTYKWAKDLVKNIKEGRVEKVRKAVEALRDQYLTPVKGSALDIASTAFLRSGKLADYFDSMPAIGEITPKEIFKYDPKAKEYIATYLTKGGELKPAIRQSGFYALKEFADAIKGYKDISKREGAVSDPTRLTQAIDQGHFGGPIQRFLTWPLRRAALARNTWVDTQKAKIDAKIVKQYKITSGRKAKAVGDIVEYVGRRDAWTYNTKEILDMPKVQEILKRRAIGRRKFSPKAKEDIVNAAIESRRLFDNWIRNQNHARKLRKEEEIPYRKFYRTWIMETNLWAKLWGLKMRPAEVMEKPEMPDFILRNRPFNARAEARTGLLAKYPKERNIVKLLADYAETAGKDIFDTNAIHYAKIHTAVLRAARPLNTLSDIYTVAKAHGNRVLYQDIANLKAVRNKKLTTKQIVDYLEEKGVEIVRSNKAKEIKNIEPLEEGGLENAASAIDTWVAEAFAGTKPRLSRWATEHIPVPLRSGMFKIRRGITRSVFPLNWSWNLFVQTSSAGLTYMRYGNKASIYGLQYFTNPILRQAIRQNVYTSIVKREWGGTLVYQDLSASVARSRKLNTSVIDSVESFANALTSYIEDGLTGHAIAAAYYHGKTTLGLKGRALWEYASEGGAKTQSMYNMADQPGWLRAREVGAVAPFQTFAFEVFNTVREMNLPVVRRAVGKTGIYETMSANSAAGKALLSNRLKMLARWTAAMYVTNAVTDKVIGRKVWQVSSFLPFYGIIMGSFSGMSPAQMRLLPQSFISDFYKGVRTLLVYGEFRDLRRFVLRYNVIGGTQINRTIEGIEAVAKGKVEDVRGRTLFKVETPLEKGTAITLGPYRTSKALERSRKSRSRRGIIGAVKKMEEERKKKEAPSSWLEEKHERKSSAWYD